MSEVVIEKWEEKFAWYPVRSSWSGKRIWFKKYHLYEYQYMKLGRTARHRFLYTQNEYLMMILRHEEKIY